MEIMIAAAMKKDIEILKDAVRMIGGGHVDGDTRMARAAMIEVICIKAGNDAGDAIMDEIGL